jgi:hypothetical protein
MWYLVATDTYTPIGSCDVPVPINDRVRVPDCVAEKTGRRWVKKADQRLRCGRGVWLMSEDLDKHGCYVGSFPYYIIQLARYKLNDIVLGQIEDITTDFDEFYCEVMDWAENDCSILEDFFHHKFIG